MIIERWISEEISGTKEINKRKIGKQFKRMKADDIIICTELSRLGLTSRPKMAFSHF